MGSPGSVSWVRWIGSRAAQTPRLEVSLADGPGDNGRDVAGSVGQLCQTLVPADELGFMDALAGIPVGQHPCVSEGLQDRQAGLGTS